MANVDANGNGLAAKIKNRKNIKMDLQLV